MQKQQLTRDQRIINELGMQIAQLAINNAVQKVDHDVAMAAVLDQIKEKQGDDNDETSIEQ